MELFVYRNADSILKIKELLDEIYEILGSIQRVDHREIQNGFSRKGWDTEKRIFP